MAEGLPTTATSWSPQKISKSLPLFENDFGVVNSWRTKNISNLNSETALTAYLFWERMDETLHGCLSQHRQIIATVVVKIVKRKAGNGLCCLCCFVKIKRHFYQTSILRSISFNAGNKLREITEVIEEKCRTGRPFCIEQLKDRKFIS